MNVYEYALKIPCSRCEAKVGEPCTTIAGKKTDIHAGRIQPLADAQADGYTEGARDQQKYVEQQFASALGYTRDLAFDEIEAVLTRTARMTG